MSDDTIALKTFIIKLSRTLSKKVLSNFGSQLFSFCSHKNIRIPSKASSFLDLMSFAFKQGLITSQNTDLISQLIYESERYDLNEELYNLEKSFKKERRSRANSHPHELTPSDRSSFSPYTTNTKTEASSPKHKATRKPTYRRHTSKPEEDVRERMYTTLLTDIEVVTYCSQIAPDEWKQLAVIGFKLTLIQVQRIDYDCRTMQDKAASMFSAWKNLAFTSYYYPPYTKQGLRQAAVSANLNGLIHRLHLE